VVYQMQTDAPLAAQRPPFTDATRDAVKAQLEALRAEFPAPQTHTGDKP
jgi:hypothetical protein